MHSSEYGAALSLCLSCCSYWSSVNLVFSFSCLICLIQDSQISLLTFGLIIVVSYQVSNTCSVHTRLMTKENRKSQLRKAEHCKDKLKYGGLRKYLQRIKSELHIFVLLLKLSHFVIKLLSYFSLHSSLYSLLLQLQLLDKDTLKGLKSSLVGFSRLLIIDD